MTIQTILREGRLSPDQEKTYFHVPFEMPAGAQRLEVAYHYNAQISSNPTVLGGNTIDLGVFDERGIEFLHAGFRGWSGSERDHFVITADEATPGYLPGALNRGTWNVLLGLYKIASQGCDYLIEIHVTTGEPVARGAAQPAVEPPPFADLPASPPPALAAPWLRGELHCHTYHSDGVFSPQALTARARERGLDFLAISDHNTTSAQRELAELHDPGLILIRGVETTTLIGHFNVWGIPDWIDFRINQAALMRLAVQYANDRGGLTSCAHPKPFGPDWERPEVDNFHCVEVWNGPWNGLDEASLEFWLALLSQGLRKPAVGGSDYHREGEQAGGVDRDLGTPTNWVLAPGKPSAEAILSAVRQGHVSLSDQPDGPFIELRAGEGYATLQGDVLPAGGAGDRPVQALPVQVRWLRAAGLRLRLLDQRGVLWEGLVADDDQAIQVKVNTAGSLYVRAELRDSDDRMHALTNPVYLPER